MLENSGFLPEENLIEIMNPMEEGLYGWFTVNFLLSQFENIEKVSIDHDQMSNMEFKNLVYYEFFLISYTLNCFLKLDQSFISLDLGGGSTQVTFAPQSYEVKGLEGRKHFIHDVNVLQKPIKVSRI